MLWGECEKRPPARYSRINIYNKWDLHGGKITMLHLNLSGHDIFKKRFGTSPEKHCLTAMPYRLFSRKLTKLTLIRVGRQTEIYAPELVTLLFAKSKKIFDKYRSLKFWHNKRKFGRTWKTLYRLFARKR